METIKEFEARSYMNIPKDICLVWNTLHDKVTAFNHKKAPEVWDIGTARRYLDIIKERELIL